MLFPLSRPPLGSVRAKLETIAEHSKANASSGAFDHINITVHNGAANVYAYGTDTIVNVSNAWLYSSGPVSQYVYQHSYVHQLHTTDISGYMGSAMRGHSPCSPGANI